jgi:hypothetical protein
MTVSTTIIKSSHNGNGSTTTFAYSFRILSNSDLVVIIRNNSTGTETTKTLTTHYTVSGAGDPSGGSITFTSGNIPASGETVVIRRNVPQTQSIDYIANDPFPAETHEEGLDRATMIAQQVSEATDRSIKLSRTNTMTSTEFTVGATDRANKILAFDGNGEISVTQELGTFKGNWSSGTAYAARDLVKDTSTNNIFIVNTAHTASGSQPLTTNTNSAKYDLIVDAATATTAQTAASNSATAAANSATAAATSETNAANSANSATSSASTATTKASEASTSATNAENAKNAAEAALDTFDDKFLGSKSSDPTVDNDGNALTDGALYFNTTLNVMKVYDLGNTQWKQLVPTTSQQANIDTVAANNANITTVAGQITPTNNISSVVSNATNIGLVGGSITNVNLVGGSITNVNEVGNNMGTVNEFGERYRVSSSAPTTSLNVGDLYFDTTQNELKVYKSSGWSAAGSTINGTSARFTYTASANQTVFTGSDNNGNTLAYDAGFVDVYLNGVKMVNGVDVTVTSGSSVVLASGANASDTVDIVGFGTFNVASIAASSITSGTLNNDRLPSPTLVVKGDGSSVDGSIQLNCHVNTHGVKIKAPPHSAGQSYTLILPQNTGTNGQVLASNGSSTNQLSWIDATETKPTVANVSQTISPATATTISITGTNFVSIPQVDFINGSTGAITRANTVSFTNATTLSVNVTLAAGNYYVRIENPDGNAGRSTNNIITASTAPSFSTAAGSIGTVGAGESVSLSVSATSDSSVTITETTSVLTSNANTPAATMNLSLASNGNITGTAPSPTNSQTYNFTLRATDAEGQTVDRAFSITISVGATGGGQFN